VSNKKQLSKAAAIAAMKALHQNMTRAFAENADVKSIGEQCQGELEVAVSKALFDFSHQDVCEAYAERIVSDTKNEIKETIALLFLLAGGDKEKMVNAFGKSIETLEAQDEP